MRVLGSLVAGLVLGLGLGLYLGWVQFPVEFVNSPAAALAQQYKDDYTVMIAEGYLQERDASAAVARLRALALDNIPEHVQTTTERYISTSRRLEDIRALVALSEALGRLTPVMAPYRPLDAAGGQP